MLKFSNTKLEQTLLNNLNGNAASYNRIRVRQFVKIFQNALGNITQDWKVVQ